MKPPRIDCLQYADWSEKIFKQMREGGVDAVHATIAYHETFRETAANIGAWNRLLRRHADLVVMGRSGDDVRRAQQQQRTAIFFGLQNPSPIEDDITLVELCHTLGVRFMQLSYNNQSLLAAGCYEQNDPGVTRFGREVIAEMNRVGMVIDMSHSGEYSTLEAIDLSARPIAVTHANPSWWHPLARNKSDAVLKALAQRGGMMGFSLYPLHLKNGGDCQLAEFCAMVADCAERYGVEHFGIGSDLCQDRDKATLTWMRNGRWHAPDSSASPPTFPPQPTWFKDNRDFDNIAAGLTQAGFTADEVAAIMGGNWQRFYDDSFQPTGAA